EAVRRAIREVTREVGEYMGLVRGDLQRLLALDEGVMPLRVSVEQALARPVLGPPGAIVTDGERQIVSPLARAAEADQRISEQRAVCGSVVVVVGNEPVLGEPLARLLRCRDHVWHRHAGPLSTLPPAAHRLHR